jgi:hypothetical protein
MSIQKKRIPQLNTATTLNNSDYLPVNQNNVTRKVPVNLVKQIIGDEAAKPKEIELQVSSTHIQWKYSGEYYWNNLISIDSLRGSGENGSQGAQGSTGNQGAQGNRGYQGVQGTQGSVGVQGVQGQQGGRGESTSIYRYYANTTVGGYPGNGFLSWNNVSQSASNSIRVSHITSDGLDIDVYLSLLDLGQTIIIQDANLSSNYQKWLISGSPMAGGSGAAAYWDIPVSLIESGGTGSSGFSQEHGLFLGVFTGIAGSQGPQGVQGTQGSVVPLLPPGIKESYTVNNTTAPQAEVFDIASQQIKVYTINTLGNYSINVRASSVASLNSSMNTGELLSIVFIVTQGSTKYSLGSFKIDNVTQTVHWQGKATPVTLVNSYSYYSFSILKAGDANFLVFGSMNSFGL